MEAPGQISFRPFRPSDLPLGLRLKQAAGWNQTEADWQLLLRLDSGAHLVAEYAGIPAGTLTAIDYGSFRWIGMVLVDPAYRKKGIGTALLREAIRQAGADLTLRLDATPAGRQLYTQLGFVAERALYRMERPPMPLPLPTAFSCQPLQAGDIGRIAIYDAAVFGTKRQAVLENLWEREPSFAGYTQLQGHITGYFLGRKGSEYLQIGPLVANDRAAARALLTHALTASADQPVVLDTFVQDGVWLSLLHELGFRQQRPLIRMYHGAPPPMGQPHRHFAIAGPELG